MSDERERIHDAQTQPPSTLPPESAPPMPASVPPISSVNAESAVSAPIANLTQSNVFARAPTPLPARVDDMRAEMRAAMRKLDVTPPNPLTLPPRNRADPTIGDVILHDPTLPMSTEARVLAAADADRWSRRGLLPWVRALTRSATFAIRCVKRVLPLQVRSQRALDALSVWLLRHFVSADAVQLLLRHCIVETNLLAFIAKHAGVALSSSARPTNLDELAGPGGAFLVEHDLAAFNLVIDVGLARSFLERRRDLDFSMLAVPPIDGERERRRLVELDLESALCLLNVVCCLFTTEREYERAVNRCQLDESVCAMLAELTGDATLRTWAPLKFPARVLSSSSSQRDVPGDLLQHMLVCEYAHTQLEKLRDRSGDRG